MLFEEQLTGTVIAGKYELGRLIGRGAYGAVYEAAELLAGEYVDSVAVKLCQPTDEQEQRLIELRRTVAGIP